MNEGHSDQNASDKQDCNQNVTKNIDNITIISDEQVEHGYSYDAFGALTQHNDHCVDEVAESESCKLAQAIVKKHTLASLSLGLVPIPLVDITALTVAQGNMLRSLANHYALPFSDLHIKSLITTTLGSSLPILGSIGVSSVTKSIPGVGSLLGSASVSVLSGAMTYAIGQVFIAHFSSGGTMDDLDSLQAQQLFQRELVTGKRFAQKLIDEQLALMSMSAK